MAEQLSQDLQLHLEGYKLLAELLQNDDSLFWRRNEVFLVINGGMLTILGLIRPSSATTALSSPNLSLKVVSLGICLTAAIMCVLWFLIAKRSEAFYDHWYEQLIFLEKHFLAPLNIFRTADEYFSKGSIKLGKGEKRLELDPVSRWIHIFVAIQIVAIVFAVLWLSMGLYLLSFT